MTAKGYLIAQATVAATEAYAAYAQAVSDLYGARPIVKLDTALVKEGSPRGRTELDTFDRAQAFWDSPQYRKARASRVGAAGGDFILIEGAD